MNEKQSISDSNKAGTPQNGGGNVGQYVPQVFMVPYYAPHPGFGGYSQGQQLPHVPQQMLGQMPQGAHPAAMPVSGMQPLPIGHMAPMPMPTVVNSAMASSPASGSSIPPQEQVPSKVNAGDDKSERMQSSHQMLIPRACWTPVEEEILVKTYAEFTIGKKLKKINRKTWETIANTLFQESKKHISQASIKSWMQCKDKWNNMIKKHKLQKSECLKGPVTDANMRERPSLYDLMERVLSYENGSGELAGYSDQENHYTGEEATMIVRIGESNSGNEEIVHERLSSGLEREGCQGSHEKNTGNEEVTTENRDEYGLPQQVDRHMTNIYSNTFANDGENDNDDQESDSHVAYPQSISKRQLADHSEDSTNKRARMLDTEETTANEKLCQILTHQTELLERMHAQHCELMQQVRMSEENTRMMVTQAIKDLGTILHKLIKSEQF